MLERTGAKTALLITEGFRDIYEIGRINRPDAYNLFFRKHVPLVERALRFEVRERMLADGEVLHAARRGGGARAVPSSSSGRGVEAVAILLPALLRNPAHEQRVKAHRAGAPARARSSPRRTSCRRNTASSSAARPRWPTPTSARACSATSREIDAHIEQRRASAATSASCSRPAACYESQQAQARVRAHAGVGSGGRRDRRAGAVPRARAAATRSPSTWAAPRPRPA